MGRENLIFVVFISLVCIFLVYIPTGYENPSMINNTLRVKAKVIDVDNDDLQNYGVITTGTQVLHLEILRGKFKGDTLRSTNVLMGQLKIDKIFQPGDKVLALPPKMNSSLKNRK